MTTCNPFAPLVATIVLVANLALVVPAHSYRAEDFLRATASLQVIVVSDADDPVAAGSLIRSSLELDAEEVARVSDILARLGTERALGVDERSVRFAAALSDELGITQGLAKAVEHATRKDHLRRALGEAELPQPRWAVADRVAAIDVAWLQSRLGPPPWILKPLDRTASLGVVRVEPSTLAWGLHELRSILAEDEPVLTERFVDGPEFAIEGILDDGRLEVVEIFEKPGHGAGPTFWEELYLAPARLSSAEREELSSVLERAARTLGLSTTPIHAEVRLSGGIPWILELAPRTIGGRCARALRFEGGQHLEDLVVQHVLGLGSTRAERRGGPVGIWMVPTPSDGVFRGFEGLEEVRRLPGVDAVEITTAPGSVVFSPPRTQSYLGFVFVRGISRANVLERLAAARGVLRPMIEPLT